MDELSEPFRSKLRSALTAAAAAGVRVVVTDGRRSVAQQASVAAAKPGLAAPVGRSRHQLGLAADVEGDVEGFTRYARAAGLRPLASEPYHFEEDRPLTREERAELVKRR